jgi:hypothetical protein
MNGGHLLRSEIGTAKNGYHDWCGSWMDNTRCMSIEKYPLRFCLTNQTARSFAMVVFSSCGILEEVLSWLGNWRVNNALKFYYNNMRVSGESNNTSLFNSLLTLLDFSNSII